MTLFTIQGGNGTPSLVFRSNPDYALYHWLRANCHTGIGDDRLDLALHLIRTSINRLGPRGVAEPWEAAMAAGQDTGESIRAFEASVQSTADAVTSAMLLAKPIFLAEYWPDREQLIGGAVESLGRLLELSFARMAADHARQLDLRWPREIDVYLVSDCGERGGAYSHPLTIDVSQLHGIELCETVLHEATHVADVHGHEIGHACLGDRLQAFLAGHVVPPRQCFNVWHGVIFAASAASIRAHLAIDHRDYAASRGLYEFFGVPQVAATWHEFATHGADELDFFSALLRQTQQA